MNWKGNPQPWVFEIGTAIGIGAAVFATMICWNKRTGKVEKADCSPGASR